MTSDVLPMPKAELATFVACLLDPDDLVEIRRLPGKYSTWHKASELGQIAATLSAENQRGEGIYIGVNPRRRQGGKNAASVLLARSFFADFDGVDLAAARLVVERAGFPTPTLWIVSGGGVHVYWRLIDPIDDLAVWTRYQKSLIALCGSDPAIHDPPRVMRAPGLLNYKYKPPRPCRIAEADPVRRYNLEAFRADVVAAASAEPCAHRRGTAKTRRGNNQPIAEGSRNQALTQLAGAMRRLGAAPESILTALTSENQHRCQPPLPEPEVARIAQSVARYDPAGDRALQWRPFPVDAMPEPMKSFVSEGAAALGCDPAMIALPALTTCGAAIGTTRRIQLRRQWNEPSVLWCVVIARSGTLKSPAFDLAVSVLRDAQAEAVKDFEQRMAEYEERKAEYEEGKRNRRSKKEGGGVEPSKPAMPTLIRYLVSDTTCEAIGPILQRNPRGLLLLRDEIAGWLVGFNEYKRGQGRDVANWLEMHRAGQAIIDRKSSPHPIFIPRAAVSVAGTIQPSTIRTHLTREYFGSGLAARLLLADPPPIRKQWTNAEVSELAERRYRTAVEQLLALTHRRDQSGDLKPIDLPMAPEARALYVSFYNEFADEQFEAASDDLASAFSKLEGYAPRFALQFQLVRWADGAASGDIVDVESMALAIELTRWFVHETGRIYSRWSQSEPDTGERELVDWIGAKDGTITVRELERGPRKYRPRGAAEAALNRLVRDGWGYWDHKSTGEAGAPAKRFRLHPPTGIGDEIRAGGGEVEHSVAVATVTKEEAVWEA